MGFKIRINLRKQKHYQLRDLTTGELQKDQAKLGPIVELLPPCLTPELTEAQRRDSTAMSTRYLEDADIMMQLDHEMTSDDLATNWPVYYPFFPSPETMRRLILRMT